MKEGTIPVRTGASQSCDYRANRRTVTKGIAWAVPAVLSAVTVPAFAASGCEDVPGPSFAQLERWSISNPTSGELISPASNGIKIIGGQEYWMSESTAAGNEKASIVLRTAYRADYDSEAQLRPGCRYSFKYSVAAHDADHGRRKGKGDVKLDVYLYDPDVVQVRNSGHTYTTKPRQNTNKSTSVPLGGQVSAHEVYVTAQEGLYRLETVITVAAEEKRRDKVVARAIGITSPCFEFAG